MKKMILMNFTVFIAIYPFSPKEQVKEQAGIFNYISKDVTITGQYQAGLVALITREQRDFAVLELKRTKSFLEKELKGLSEKQLKFKIAPDKWSIEEIVEHIALAENGIFQVVQGSLATPADSAKRKEITVSDRDISKRLTNRTTKVQSPESIKPTGKFASAAVAYQAFDSRRVTTIEYIATTTDDLLNHFWKHPATGTIDLFQTILLISAHSERHILQIVEVKTSKDFPSD